MKIGIFSLNFPPNKGGVSQSLGSFYLYHKKMKKNPPYVFTGISKQNIEEKENIFRFTTRNNAISPKLIFSLIIYYLEYLKHACLKIKHWGIIRSIKLVTPLFSKAYLYMLTCAYNYANAVRKTNIKLNIVLIGWLKFSGLAAYFYKKLTNTPNVLICHGRDILKYPREAFLTIETADGIVTRTRAIKNLLMKEYFPKMRHYARIHDGIVEEEYQVPQSKENLRNSLSVKNDIFIMTVIGRLIKRKGVDHIIQAINLLEDKGITRPEKPIQLFVIGDGEERSNLVKLTKKLGLSETVIFLGAIGNELRNKYLKLSDIFIMTPFDENINDIEGFGIVYLEANYYKVPVIGTDSGGVPEAIEDGVSGLIARQKDVNDIAEKIQVFYNNDGIRSELGEKGYERVKNHLMWEHILDKYLHFFKRVLKDGLQVI